MSDEMSDEVRSKEPMNLEELENFENFEEPKDLKEPRKIRSIELIQLRAFYCYRVTTTDDCFIDYHVTKLRENILSKIVEECMNILNSDFY